MALDRLTQITSSGISSTSTITVSAVAGSITGVVTATSLSVTGSVTTGLDVSGIVTATTVQVGSATTIHTTGIDLGSGNITSHNINSTGIITSTSFVGPVTGNVTGNLTGNVTGNVTGNLTGTATTASSLSGTPNVIVGVLTATDAVINGNLTVQGTTTTLDTTLTEVDRLEVGANNATVGVAITQSGTGDILRLYDSSTQVVTVTDGGNVGIGSDIPATKLNVIGDARIEGFSNAKIQIKRTGNTVANGSIEFIGSDNSFGWGLIANYDAGGSNFNIKEGSNSRLYIKSGNVGINSTQPTAKLDVVGNTQVTGDSQVTGNARVTGILTVGQNSTTINGALEYPSIRPTLDLNFAATKTLDRRITFTRDSLGTYTDELGVLKYVSNNVPRFDHDPATGESLGLLVEESRSNIQLNSAAPYSSGGSQIVWTTGLTAPDGTSTAVKLAATAVDTFHDMTTNIYPSSFPSGTYTYSMYAKSDGLNRFNIKGANLTAVTFDLSTGTVVEGAGGTITPAGNGWYRCSVTESTTNNFYQYSIVLNADDESGYVQFLGDGTSGIIVWGWQMEAGSFPTSYIPTSGSTVTRAADFAKITGTNFSSWYNQSEGTFVSKTNNLKGLTAPHIFTLDSPGYEIALYGNTQNPYAQAFGNIGGTGQQWNMTKNVDPSSSSFAYKVNDISFVVSGGTASVDTSAIIPSVNRLIFCSDTNGAGRTNGSFSRLTYYNKRLPNAQLQGLTAQ